MGYYMNYMVKIPWDPKYLPSLGPWFPKLSRTSVALDVTNPAATSISEGGLTRGVHSLRACFCRGDLIGIVGWRCFLENYNSIVTMV